MHAFVSRHFSYIAFGISLLAALTAFLVWSSSYQWHIPLNTFYVIFPLLGLMAFSIMWSQYMAGPLRHFSGSQADLKKYYSVTGWAVLVLIILHPSLLIAQRFLDGYGLPPHSYETYVAPSLAWVTLLGSACLLVFLVYGAQRYLHKYSWWRYETILNDLAVLGIFYHSLRLGSQLQMGWFRYVWYFYGITIIAVLVHSYAGKLQARRA